MATPSAALRAANDNAEDSGVIPGSPHMAAVTAEIAVTDDEDESGGNRWLTALLAVSLAAHAVLFFELDHGRRAAPGTRRRPPSEVTVTVAPPPAPPAPAPEAKPAPKTAPRRIAIHAAPRPSAAPPPPPSEAETPADFSGTTLTNDGPGLGWASVTGNGEAMHGPIGTPGAKVTGRSREGVAGEARGRGAPPPPTVAIGSLSRPPEPPDLNAALERHYPEAARRQGTPGQAVLKARITPDGHVRDLVVVSQSAPGFGDACRATLRDSVWSAPLDKDGQAVATFVTYTCRFEVK